MMYSSFSFIIGCPRFIFLVHVPHLTSFVEHHFRADFLSVLPVFHSGYRCNVDLCRVAIHDRVRDGLQTRPNSNNVVIVSRRTEILDTVFRRKADFSTRHSAPRLTRSSRPPRACGCRTPGAFPPWPGRVCGSRRTGRRWGGGVRESPRSCIPASP